MTVERTVSPLAAQQPEQGFLPVSVPLPHGAPRRLRVPREAAGRGPARPGAAPARRGRDGRAHRRSGPPPRPTDRQAPAAARHYCITRTAAQLMDVYAAAVSSPSPLGVIP
ncbi:hypothetical protein GCM10023080_011000 [Streptomyces pseudoechinosporeus]